MATSSGVVKVLRLAFVEPGRILLSKGIEAGSLLTFQAIKHSSRQETSDGISEERLYELQTETDRKTH